MGGRRHGLTLLEVMISVLMLGTGLVAIASLFPVAGTIQRSTYDDVVLQQVSDSVSDAIDSRGFDPIDLVAGDPLALLDFQVHPMPQRILDGKDATPTFKKWGLADRCYPTAVGGDPEATNRSYYWIPLMRRVNLIDWQIYVFIVTKDEGQTYGSHTGAANAKDPVEVPIVTSVEAANLGIGSPNTPNPLGLLNGNGNAYGQESSTLLVLNASSRFQIGDLVLDSLGVAHTVIDVKDNNVKLDGYVSPLVTKLWYSPHPSRGQSPTRRILTFGSGVIFK